MRLSRKASTLVGNWSHDIEYAVRCRACERAESQGREFADESDVRWAMEVVARGTLDDYRRAADILNKIE